MEGLRKTKRNYNQDSQRPDRDLNWTPLNTSPECHRYVNCSVCEYYVSNAPTRGKHNSYHYHMDFSHF
jgi:hypothetical protein